MGDVSVFWADLKNNIQDGDWISEEIRESMRIAFRNRIDLGSLSTSIEKKQALAKIYGIAFNIDHAPLALRFGIAEQTSCLSDVDASCRHADHCYQCHKKFEELYVDPFGGHRALLSDSNDAAWDRAAAMSEVGAPAAADIALVAMRLQKYNSIFSENLPITLERIIFFLQKRECAHGRYGTKKENAVAPKKKETTATEENNCYTRRHYETGFWGRYKSVAHILVGMRLWQKMYEPSRIYRNQEDINIGYYCDFIEQGANDIVSYSQIAAMNIFVAMASDACISFPYGDIKFIDSDDKSLLPFTWDLIQPLTA